jgi:lysophospholipase L1-like esterase
VSDPHARSRSRLRRLAAACLTLVVLDAFVPGWVARAERARYESGPVFRFQYSDLFAVGPVVDYLRDHPRGDRPRAVFLGDSIVWGYRLRPGDSLPAQFARLRPDVRVLNFAVNGFGSGSAFLVLKDVIGSIDTVYLEIGGRAVNAGLARLIPVADEDIRRFGLEAPNRGEQRLERLAGFWRLYRDAYRLQAALFGTSTRNYIYSHKAALLWWRGTVDDTDVAPTLPATSRLVVGHDVSAVNPGERRRQDVARAEPWLWEYATFIRRSGKRAIFFAPVSPSNASENRDWADLNRIFRGSVVFARVGVPDDMKIDPTHLSAAGSRALAELLDALTTAELEHAGAVH